MERVFVSMAMLPALLMSTMSEATGGGGVENTWTLSDPILSSGPIGTFSEIAVKDPSIVYFEGMWHLFFTARSREASTTGYVSAKDLAGLPTAPRHELKMIRGRSRYGCAPQVMYYRPHGKWYLIFQNLDSGLGPLRYQPAFSTTKTISKPESWTKPKPLIQKDVKSKWIDFWVICDKTKAYLFYTQSQSIVMVRTTTFEEFPGGWGTGKKVFSPVTEAAHIYKVRGQNKYHMIYELNRGGMRLFGIAAAENLIGPWEKVTDRYATGEQLNYLGDKKAWTEMVSHGEAIRTGYDQEMEYDPKGSRLLIQGTLKKGWKSDYSSIPWKLGIIIRSESGGEQKGPVDVDQLSR